MRNRAKCKLCQSIIESYFVGDVVSCMCGEITVFNGPGMDMAPFGSEHFVRVDDNGNEIKVTYHKETTETGKSESSQNKSNRPTVLELIQSVEQTIENLERLPIHHVTSKDLSNCMVVLLNILKRQINEK